MTELIVRVRPRAAEASPVPAGIERVAGIEAAVAAIEAWGALLVLPSRSVPMPSLWELARGRRGPLAALAWDEIADVWGWKEAIATDRRAVLGRFAGEQPVLLARSLLPAVLASIHAHGEPEGALNGYRPPPEAVRIAGVLRERGPLAAHALRRLAGLARKVDQSRFERALAWLERRYQIAAVGIEERAGGWPSEVYALTETAFPEATPELTVSPELARTTLRTRAERLATWYAADAAAVMAALNWQ